VEVVMIETKFLKESFALAAFSYCLIGHSSPMRLCNSLPQKYGEKKALTSN